MGWLTRGGVRELGKQETGLLVGGNLSVAINPEQDAAGISRGHVVNNF